jgi:hypothetical protein
MFSYLNLTVTKYWKILFFKDENNYTGVEENGVNFVIKIILYFKNLRFNLKWKLKIIYLKEFKDILLE